MCSCPPPRRGPHFRDLHHAHATQTYELNQTIQALRLNQATDSAAISNKPIKLENVPEMLEKVNDAVQGTRAITIADIEGFPSFMKPIVQAAVNSAVETQFQNMKILSHFQQGSEHTRNTMSIKEIENLKG